MKEIRLAVVYGSFVSVGVPMSGMKGGMPAVDQKVPGVGNEIPNANWTSRSASGPASERF